ncbi:MAG: hypothetical protein HYV54_01070 [Parcubacteria group bacterium]|nr:hypothetical protein [Parcubacteria group bacterium]
MKPKKGQKTAPPSQEQDIIVPALIILLGIWLLATSPVRPDQNNSQPDETSISQEMASNADSSSDENTHWFAQAIKTRKEVN